MLNINKIFDYLKRPELYTESSNKFWDDDHISKCMLEAHLNPDQDAASRKHSFIDKSVDWISKIAPQQNYKNILDIGCGPGLYTERFYEKGYTVTGIDFSRRSLNYAREKASEKKYDINYIYKNYLEIEYDNMFDLIILIYCDFGVLSDVQREILLKKLYRALKPGGKLFFDVHTPYKYEGISESKTWSFDENGGFWKPDSYICMDSRYIYEGNIRLTQYVIIDKMGNVDAFNIWDHYYTKDTLIEEVNKAGFTNYEIYSDVSGAVYYGESPTMCIVVEK